MSFSNKEELFLQYVMTIYWFVCAGIFFGLIFIDRSHDREQAKKDKDIIETIAYKDEENDFENLPFMK
jgi:hypothetical protein